VVCKLQTAAEDAAPAEWLWPFTLSSPLAFGAFGRLKAMAARGLPKRRPQEGAMYIQSTLWAKH
jgi:hypothetical protein